MSLELTLHTVITHHKANEMEDAEQLYRSILTGDPKHPYANHNLGVLLKQSDKADFALPFFKTALEANPNQGQYWISYIDTLIHLQQYDAAQNVLNQGQTKGLKGDAVNQLKERLNSKEKPSSESVGTQSKALNVNAMLARAKSHAKKGQLDEAKQLYHRVLETFPQNQHAKKGLKALQKGQVNKKNSSHPPQAQITAVISLYSQGQVKEALIASETLFKDYPNEPLFCNINGACYKALGQPDAAIKSYKKALAIKPDFAEAYSNLGVTLQELGQLEEAVKHYEQALSIKPDYAEAHSNLGNALQELGQLEEAVKRYEQALAIKPDFAEAHSNLGVTLQELGQLEAAVKSHEQALVIKPDYAEAHYNLGITLKELGQLEAAVKSHEQALAIKPDYSEAHYNLGIILKELGQLEAAVKSYEQALAIKPDFAEAHYNLGITLKELGQLEAAVKSYEQALAIKPDYAEAYSNLGVTFQELGQLEEAVKHYEQALAIKPDYSEAHYNLGITLQDLGQLEEAVKHYEQALAIEPDFAEAHSNLGITLQDLGQLEEAVKRYGQALAIKPDFAEAHSNLGVTLQELGQLETAVKSFEQALSIDSSNQLFWASFSNVLRVIRFKSFNESMVPYLLQALQQPSIRPKNISEAIISMLRHHPNLHIALEACKTGSIKDKANQLADQLTSIPLLLQLMELCPIPDTEIERLLRLIRQATLRQLTDETIEPANLSFYVGLALHCFTNEYVFLESSEETSEIEQLENKINSLLANNKPVPPLWVALLGSYRPLHLFSWSNQLSQSNSTNSIQKILTQQIDEVREEQRLRSKIKALSTINNNVSQAVREQYEENPYPRWVNPGLSPKPKTIRTILQELKIDLNLTGQHFPSHPEILIAGCGTGQHSLCTASRFSNSSVLAVDLSLSSLSYAIRKTQELGISNIDYMQADILELHKLDRQFDLIESSGVLHHMAEPLAGWEILVDLLRPRGLMKIGLYSEIARQHIVETRTFIAKNDYDSSQEAIRQCRVEIIEMPTKTDSEISKVLNSTDFYSLSTCRDLLFHVQEHRFTLPEIETALKELGLVFLGFELQDLQLKNRFKELDPRKESLTSLPLWHQFELDHPDSFAGMYQFWVQKI
jgi:tetratricopeptide (TPR) repeat protein/2-polyprenyl-3-methyl-5-hydroxy-6-metoxy-1,4-benzoquinol methylase